jgi:ABC-type multidrug transport system ATPase subunit
VEGNRFAYYGILTRLTLLSCAGKLLFNDIAGCGVGFVSQQDFLLPFLTVKETLTFAATLIAKSVRVRGDAVRYDSKQIVPELVDKVILELGLKEVADTFIGQDGVSIAGSRGISGGEKRRVSVGIQILSDPQVLVVIITV